MASQPLLQADVVVQASDDQRVQCWPLPLLFSLLRHTHPYIRSGGFPYTDRLLRQAVLLQLASEFVAGAAEELTASAKQAASDPCDKTASPEAAPAAKDLGASAALKARSHAGAADTCCQDGSADLAIGPDEDMRRLAAEADAAMARDFAETWHPVSDGVDGACTDSGAAHADADLARDSRVAMHGEAPDCRPSESYGLEGTATVQDDTGSYWAESVLSLRGIADSSVQVCRISSCLYHSTAQKEVLEFG
jgi:hypothetical protein